MHQNDSVKQEKKNKYQPKGVLTFALFLTGVLLKAFKMITLLCVYYKFYSNSGWNSCGVKHT